MSTRTRCNECGWLSPPTTPSRAQYAARRHSCAKQRADLARAARVTARESADGPTMPCTHPRAHHPHGTRARYTLDRCHCRDCRQANRSAERDRQRQIAYGRWQPYVDAGPTRSHIAQLREQGVGLKRLATLSGVSHGSLSQLVYGCPVRGRGPSRRIRPDSAAKILAVAGTLDDLGSRVGVDATGTHRRLQALVARGWSMARLARQLGVDPTNLPAMMRRAHVSAGIARAVEDVYEIMWNTPPPEGDHRSRIAASRARRYAAARGWLPPMAWDDLTIDAPTSTLSGGPAIGEIDEIAVERRCSGDWTVRLTRAERHLVVRRLHTVGLSDRAIQRRTGIDCRQVIRDRQTLGLPATAGPTSQQVAS